MKEWIIFMCLIAILAFFFGTLGYLKGWNKGFDEGSEFSERKLDLAFKAGELKGIAETQLKFLSPIENKKHIEESKGEIEK